MGLISPAYRLTHEFTDNGRWHRTGSGLRPGVTTVLSATNSPQKLEMLANWQARVGEAEAERIRVTATDRGSHLHHMIEAELTGEPFVVPRYDIGPPDEEEISRLWAKAQDALREIDEVFAVEAPCEWHLEGADPLSVGNGYGGSVDCVARIHGQNCVIDWKTAAKPKRLDHCDNYRQQLAAYRNAFRTTYPTFEAEHGPLSMAAIVICPVKGPLQVIELELEELLQEEQLFGQRLDRFYAQLRQKAEAAESSD